MTYASARATDIASLLRVDSLGAAGASQAPPGKEADDAQPTRE